MYSEDLTSPIARFLAMQTDHMKKIRDNLPGGPENFKFYIPTGEVDWYTFWSYLAAHRPGDSALETDLYKIYFHSSSLTWKGLNKVKEKKKKKKREREVKELYEYEIRAQSIRNWEKKKKKK